MRKRDRAGYGYGYGWGGRGYTQMAFQKRQDYVLRLPERFGRVF